MKINPYYHPHPSNLIFILNRVDLIKLTQIFFHLIPLEKSLISIRILFILFSCYRKMRESLRDFPGGDFMIHAIK